MNPFHTTTPGASYTTRLLNDLDESPGLRVLAFVAAALLVSSSIALSILLRAPIAAPTPARIMQATIVIVTPQPTMPPQPTATPVIDPASVPIIAPEPAQEAVAPAPQPVEEWHPPMAAEQAAPADEWKGVPFVVEQEWHPPQTLPDVCANWSPPAVYPPECP